MDLAYNEIEDLDAKSKESVIPRISFYRNDAKNKSIKLPIKGNRLQADRVVIFV